MRIYIDTSVINGIYAQDPRIVEITQCFFQSAKFGKFTEKIIPPRYIADALHIAMATIHNIPVLVSWNFEHIVRYKTRIGANRVNKNAGYPQIDLCSPEEV